mgnify:CR=1 FL=1
MAVEAIRNYSVGLNQNTKSNFKSAQSFTSNQEVDEEKSNATKYMIGATALAAVICLGVAGYNGKLGKGIQEFLGGVEKATEKAGEKAGNSVPSTGTKTGDTLTQGAEKTEELAEEAKQAANGILKGEDAVNNLNEYYKTFGVDGKAFIPKNDQNIVIVMQKDEKGNFYKWVYNKEDFQLPCHNSYPNADKAIARTSINSYSGRTVINKELANGSSVKMTGQSSDNGTYGVSSLLSGGSYHLNTYNKSTIYDIAENGKKINPDVNEEVWLSFYGGPKNRFRTGEEGFEDAKKECLANLRERLKWSDEPIRK